MEHQLVSADDALNHLMEGNKRLIAHQTINQMPDPVLRKKLAGGQDPFAIVIACIDSRVDPPELFDTKSGDMFTPQSIGNIVDDSEFAAVWYAVHASNIRLVMVVGHEKCGAVQHAIKGEKCGQCIDHVVDAIKPAVEAVLEDDTDRVRNVVIANTMRVVSKISNHPDFKSLVDSGELQIVPAYNHLESGEVELLAKPAAIAV